MCVRQTPVDAKFERDLGFVLPFIVMATFQAVKKVFTLAPTVRTLPSGIPCAPLLNLSAKAPHDPHSHGHSDTTVRSDLAPRWAGGLLRNSSGLVSKTFTTGHLLFSSVSFPISNV